MSTQHPQEGALEPGGTAESREELVGGARRQPTVSGPVVSCGVRRVRCWPPGARIGAGGQGAPSTPDPMPLEPLSCPLDGVGRGQSSGVLLVTQPPGDFNALLSALQFLWLPVLRPLLSQVPAAWHTLCVVCVCVCVCTPGCACVRMCVGLGESFWTCDAPPPPLLRPPGVGPCCASGQLWLLVLPRPPANEDALVGAESPPFPSFPGLPSALGVQPTLSASCCPWGLCGPPREGTADPQGTALYSWPVWQAEATGRSSSVHERRLGAPAPSGLGEAQGGSSFTPQTGGASFMQTRVPSGRGLPRALPAKNRAGGGVWVCSSLQAQGRAEGAVSHVGAVSGATCFQLREAQVRAEGPGDPPREPGGLCLPSGTCRRWGWGEPGSPGSG